MLPTHANTSRLFLALWPKADIQHTLLSWRDAWGWPSDAAPVRPEALHLTLHFLGNVPDSRLPDLQQGLKVAFRPFDLSFGHNRLWQHGVAVLEPDAVPDGLLQLHASLAAALDDLGLKTEARTYRPHITFARNAARATLPAHQNEHSFQWQVNGYALIRSRDGYSVVRHYDNSD